MNTRGRIKVCRFCEDKALKVDYKDETDASAFRDRTGQSHSPQNVRDLCPTSTKYRNRDQARPKHRNSALCRRDGPLITENRR